MFSYVIPTYSCWAQQQVLLFPHLEFPWVHRVMQIVVIKFNLSFTSVAKYTGDMERCMVYILYTSGGGGGRAEI